jgi:formylglycine-generating enzyme required for sulfatase activity
MGFGEHGMSTRGLATFIFWLMILALLPNAALAYTAYSCGTEGQNCFPEDETSEVDDEDRPRITVVSYGANSTFSSAMFQGIREMPCAAALFGDPAIGAAKKCTAISYNLPKVENWIPCGTQTGGNCVNEPIAPDHIRLARFGVSGRFVYMFVSKGYACPKTYFEGINFDPYENIVKECSISSNDIPVAVSSRWRPCGSVAGINGKSECVFSEPGNYLVRFYDKALGEKFRAYGHRMVTGKSFECSQASTGYTIGIGSIACQYIRLPQISKVEGQWQLVGSCQDCGDIEYKVMVGVERGNRQERESSWTREVSTEVATEVFGVEASASATFSWGGRSLLEESFALSAGMEYTVTCDKGALWQWTTEVQNTCFAENVECEVLARSRDFLCVGSGVSPSEFVSVASVATDPANAVVDKETRRAARPFQDCPQCPRMTEIPAGMFTMGSPDNEPLRIEQEGAPRMVLVPQFAIGAYEITRSQWAACVADGGCTFQAVPVTPANGDEPVSGVSWRDAAQYVDWLSGKTGKQYRLPSEAEWEYAARAGTQTPFWTGDRVFSMLANFDSSKSYNSSNATTAPGKPVEVGSYDPNAFGVYDTIGNVQEWVEDCFGPYSTAPADGSPVLGATSRSSGCEKVLRGGSWKSPPQEARSAFRYWLHDHIRWGDAGFRVARDF